MFAQEGRDPAGRRQAGPFGFAEWLEEPPSAQAAESAVLCVHALERT
jgi:hypothetical protein